MKSKIQSFKKNSNIKMIKKYFLVVLLAIFAVSCSKKVEVKGKITGGSPLERMEFIEASGVGTLPLVNLGIDKEGNFSGNFEAPKNGMYLINYAGNQAMVYLKGGQTFNFSANGMDFAGTLKVTGDAQKNNDFLTEVQKAIGTYAGKIDMGALLTKKEPEFLKEAKKIKTDIEKIVDDSAKKSSPDSDVVKFKKEEVLGSILGLLSQYEINHPMATQNPSFKTSQAFKDYVKELEKDNDNMVKNQPIYRNYLLNKLSADYQTFANANQKNAKDATNSDLFAKFLDTRKDLSQVTKDYLLAFIMGQFDIPNVDAKKSEQLSKLVDAKIKDAAVKTDLKKALFAVSGPKKGELAEENGMVKQDGKAFKFTELKGKPTLVMFYASWNPYISEAHVPVLKEVVNFYKAKMNFAYVNMDDSKEQFTKTSGALLKGFPGTNAYAEGGLNSKFAEKWGLYSFKMPSYIILDKDGKVASQFFFNLGEQAFVTEMDKQTGLKAPMANPNPTMQNPQVAPQQQQQAPPPPPATK